MGHWFWTTLGYLATEAPKLNPPVLSHPFRKLWTAQAQPLPLFLPRVGKATQHLALILRGLSGITGLG